MKVKLCERCGAEIYNVNSNAKYCTDCKKAIRREKSLKYYYEHKEECLEKHKERYDWLKSKHICARCGREKAEENRIFCIVCLEKVRINQS